MMDTSAYPLHEEVTRLRAENEALRKQVIVHDAAHSELCREVEVMREALYKAAEYATLAYEGSALIDGRIVDGLGLAEWIETILEKEQEPSV